MYPLFVFDISKQSEKLKSSVVDLQIRANFSEAVSAGTEAYAVLISDKLITFQLHGSQMSVVWLCKKNCFIFKMYSLEELKTLAKQNNIKAYRLCVKRRLPISLLSK